MMELQLDEYRSYYQYLIKKKHNYLEFWNFEYNVIILVLLHQCAHKYTICMYMYSHVTLRWCTCTNVHVLICTVYCSY